MSKSLPDLWLLSDARNDELLPRALRALPRRSAFVYRHYHLDPRARRARWHELLPLVEEGDHLAILSGSDDQARLWGADGSYGPPEAIGEAPELLRIATCHDGNEIAHANAAGANAAMLSPVFATRTHPNIPPHGYEGCADFRTPNLPFGYVMRNLTLLEGLYAVWEAVGEPA